MKLKPPIAFCFFFSAGLRQSGRSIGALIPPEGPGLDDGVEAAARVVGGDADGEPPKQHPEGVLLGQQPPVRIQGFPRDWKDGDPINFTSLPPPLPKNF